MDVSYILSIVCKFACVRLSQDLCACAYTHSLEGTLVGRHFHSLALAWIEASGFYSILPADNIECQSDLLLRQ